MECAETKDQAPDRVGASEFRTHGMAYLRTHGEQEEKALRDQDYASTFGEPGAKWCLRMVLRKSLEYLVAS
jgi:hypothetical protein